jgi:hypothetical protein
MNQLQAVAMNEGVRRKKALWNKSGRSQSGTPRRAGGLMSWAASKAVDPMVRRRALRAFFAI